MVPVGCRTPGFKTYTRIDCLHRTTFLASIGGVRALVMMEDGRVIGVRQTILFAVLMLIWAIFATSGSGVASATVVLTFDGNQLSGAQNLSVSGTLYDVSFRDGTCAQLFDDCDETSDLAFTTSGTASAAANALFDFVFVDGSLGNFDSNPGRTLGCGNPVCKTLIPFSVTIRSGFVNAVVAENWDERANPIDTVTVFQEDIDGDTGQQLATLNYALFTLSSERTPMPAPAALPLLATGLGIMGFFGWRRRQRHQGNA